MAFRVIDVAEEILLVLIRLLWEIYDWHTICIYFYFWFCLLLVVIAVHISLISIICVLICFEEFFGFVLCFFEDTWRRILIKLTFIFIIKIIIIAQFCVICVVCISIFIKEGLCIRCEAIFNVFVVIFTFKWLSRINSCICNYIRLSLLIMTSPKMATDCSEQHLLIWVAACILPMTQLRIRHVFLFWIDEIKPSKLHSRSGCSFHVMTLYVRCSEILLLACAKANEDLQDQKYR